MTKSSTKIPVEDLQLPSEVRLFHNEKITVYKNKYSIKEIKFWTGNARNFLDFDLLAHETDKKIEDISIQEITMFLAKQPRLKLASLKKSIEENGVRVSLIILDDWVLLDGNRRFFACKLLQYEYEKAKKDLPKEITEISVHIIKAEDLEGNENQRKILAEANFVPDFKVPWSLDVKAKHVIDYYNECISSKMNEDQAWKQVQDVYSVPPGEAKDYRATVELVETFLDLAGDAKDDRLKRRRIVQRHFVYFWEFYNKSHKGRTALSGDDLSEVKELFFQMMVNDRFDNRNQIRALIKSKRVDHWWNIMTESQGIKIEQVEAIIQENKAVLSVQDKIRNFHRWLVDKGSVQLDKENVRGATLKYIRTIIELLTKIIDK